VAVGRPLDAGRVHRPGIVTKAGAFGTDHALYAAWLHLSDKVEPTPSSP
jgi:D-threonate/D-erythronate kinase